MAGYKTPHLSAHELINTFIRINCIKAQPAPAGIPDDLEVMSVTASHGALIINLASGGAATIMVGAENLVPLEKYLMFSGALVECLVEMFRCPRLATDLKLGLEGGGVYIEYQPDRDFVYAKGIPAYSTSVSDTIF